MTSLISCDGEKKNIELKINVESIKLQVKKIEENNDINFHFEKTDESGNKLL
jgi:hypothetical protein